MLQILISLLMRWLKKPTSLICLGVMIVLFIPAFQAVDFEPFLSIILLIVAIILAVMASFIISGLRSTLVVLTSEARVKELAEKYPELAELEKKRSSLVGIRLLFFVACVVVFFLGILTLGVAGVGFVSIGAPIVYLLMIRKKEVELQNSFKQIIVLDELTRVFTDVQFDAHDRFSFEEIDRLRLFSDLHRTRGNDLIDAKRRDIHFCRCDMNLERVYVYIDGDGDGDERETTETIFKGSVFRFELSEPSPVRLLAATEGFANLREAGGDLKKLIGWVDEHIVETEMDEFNRRFDVYCSDQTAARILLTPQMIEGINRVGRLSGHELAMLFEGSHLYLFLSTPGVDSFEVTVSSNQSLKKQHEIIAAQVALIAAIVDNMYFKGTSMSGDTSAQFLTPAQAQIVAGKGPSAAKGKLLALKRLIVNSVHLIIFFVFIISCIYMLFASPDGIALSVGMADGVSTADNFVPVLPYMLLGGIFMGAFCFWGRRHPTGLVAAGFLLLIHFVFLIGSLMA